MEEKVSGIVLSSINFGENDKILTIFTLEQGVLSAKIKGVKKAGAKLKFASEPFCFAEFIFAKTGKNRTVINASLIESFYSIREDIIKYYAGAAVLEFVKKFCMEGIVSTELFMLAIDCLKKITYDNYPCSVLVDFLIQALRLTGYALNLNGCFDCQCSFSISNPQRIYFDYVFGGFFCEKCKKDGAREINLSTFHSLSRIYKGELLEKEECVGALRLLDFYLQAKPEEKINSLKQLLNII